MIRILALFSVILFSSSSFAGLYLEPYLGYQIGKLKSSGSVLGVEFDSDNDANGLTYGAKVGMSFVMVAVGAEYMGGSLKVDGSTVTESNIGAFVSVGLPLIKASAAYFPSSQFKGDSTAKGSGFKIGVGFTGLPLVAINLDMLNFSGTENSSDISDFSWKNNAFLLSVSLPLDL